MGRTKGAINKKKQLPELESSEQERIDLIAGLILEIIVDEQTQPQQLQLEAGHAATSNQ